MYRLHKVQEIELFTSTICIDCTRSKKQSCSRVRYVYIAQGARNRVVHEYDMYRLHKEQETEFFNSTICIDCTRSKQQSCSRVRYV